MILIFQLIFQSPNECQNHWDGMKRDLKKKKIEIWVIKNYGNVFQKKKKKKDEKAYIISKLISK